jgi:hypothetical protein
MTSMRKRQRSPNHQKNVHYIEPLQQTNNEIVVIEEPKQRFIVKFFMFFYKIIKAIIIGLIRFIEYSPNIVKYLLYIAAFLLAAYSIYDTHAIVGFIDYQGDYVSLLKESQDGSFLYWVNLALYALIRIHIAIAIFSMVALAYCVNFIFTKHILKSTNITT